MNVLDENVPDDARSELRGWRVRFRQIGREIGRSGMQDQEILRMLQSVRAPTLFTRDADFSYPRLCHPAYCLVYLKVTEPDIAEFVRKILRHPALDTRAKRMGAVIHASPAGLRLWRRHTDEEPLDWP